jgi:hypothetical protein
MPTSTSVQSGTHSGVVVVGYRRPSTRGVGEAREDGVVGGALLVGCYLQLFPP